MTTAGHVSCCLAPAALCQHMIAPQLGCASAHAASRAGRSGSAGHMRRRCSLSHTRLLIQKSNVLCFFPTTHLMWQRLLCPIFGGGVRQKREWQLMCPALGGLRMRVCVCAHVQGAGGGVVTVCV